MPSWLIDHLPRRLRTRRGFTQLLAGVGFLASAGYSLFVDGYGLVSSLLDGVLSGVFIFFFFWYLSRNLTGFEPKSRHD
jgi:hypothetical protein